MTRREFLASSTGLLLLPNLVFSQNEDFFQGKAIFQRVLDLAKSGEWHRLPMGELVAMVGKQFLETPYVGQTFELFDDREVCVINLEGLDCATFYEASLAIARTIKTRRPTQSELTKQITRIRYRSGKMNGYLSRLHYACDYFYDNELKGILNVVTDDLPGAQPFPHKVSYMSSHPDQYRQLKASPKLVPTMAKLEAEINDRKTFFLPKEKVAENEILLKTGDILGLTTTREGLDVSHTGLCFRDEEGTLRFMHASSVKKEVILDVRLSEYLAKSKINDGILVARPLEI